MLIPVDHSVATNYSMFAEGLVSSLVSILSRTRPHVSPIQSLLQPCSGGRLQNMNVCGQHITSYVHAFIHSCIVHRCSACDH